MSIKKEEFDRADKKDLKEDLYNFLLKNKNNAYTLKEIKENFRGNIDDVLLHIDLTGLIWADKVSYRDIYDHDNKLIRYYKINEKL